MNTFLHLPTDVTLTSYELLMASGVGCARNIGALKRGYKNQSGLKNGADWQVNVEGACGELALAKATWKYWDGSVNTFKSGGDVGAWQVRTRSKHNYELIVRDDDPDQACFWLVTGTAPTYIIQGWIHGARAKRDIWIQTHGGRDPAYFVPHSALTHRYNPE